MNPINKVEAVLFASGKAMSEEHIKELTELKPKETRQALEALQKAYDERAGAVFIWNEGDKWKINVKEEYIMLVKTLAAETELERAVLETLAIIAYRSPILQSDVIRVRGGGAYEYISELVDKGFVTKEKEGRSFKLKITDKFYNYFDVAGDGEIRDIFANINKPDPNALMPKGQKKLGNLDIVDAETDEEAEEDKKAREERQIEIHQIQITREDDKKNYLNDFEGRLGEVSGRINEAEKHILDEKARIENAARDSEEAESKEGEEKHHHEEKTKVEGDKNSENSEEENEGDEEVVKEKDYDNMDPQELAKDIEEKIERISKERKNIEL
jgi:segregation and condensation protein B